MCNPNLYKINMMSLRRVVTSLVAMVAICTSLSAQTIHNAHTHEQIPFKPVTSQEPEHHAHEFTDINILESSAVEDQGRSGTCWAFGALSVMQSDLMRQGIKNVNLSEMWIVRNMYYEKVVKYIRLHGNLHLSIGGAMHDVTEGVRRYGVVPEAIYQGMNYGEDFHTLGELDAVLKGFADGIIKNENGRLSMAWTTALNLILDSYFGPRPTTFFVEGVEYTPLSYAKALGLDMDDYIFFTSYTHHPYEQNIILEIPDNWLWRSAYNMPIKEMMEVLDHSLESGYTVGCAVDITEPGFSAQNNEASLTVHVGVDNWERITSRRQDEFDSYITTDDHCMQIVGTAKSNHGTPCYKLKNSWGIRIPNNGFLYMTREYIEVKSLIFMVNRKALPASLQKKLGVKN